MPPIPLALRSSATELYWEFARPRWYGGNADPEDEDEGGGVPADARSGASCMRSPLPLAPAPPIPPPADALADTRRSPLLLGPAGLAPAPGWACLFRPEMLGAGGLRRASSGPGRT